MPRYIRAALPRNTLVVGMAAVALAAPAAAHVGATPAFLRVGEPETVLLAVHNDRDVAMSGFAVTVPEGVEISELEEVAGWTAERDGAVASWSGELAGDAGQEFGVSLEAVGEPGAVTLETEQRYPDGEVVRWPVAITVVPGSGEGVDDASIGIAVAGVLLLSLAALLAYRRFRTASR